MQSNKTDAKTQTDNLQLIFITPLNWEGLTTSAQGPDKQIPITKWMREHTNTS